MALVPHLSCQFDATHHQTQMRHAFSFHSANHFLLPLAERSIFLFVRTVGAGSVTNGMRVHDLQLSIGINDLTAYAHPNTK